MGAFAVDELARRDGLAALLFRLEGQRPQVDLKELIDEVIGWFREHPDFEPLKQLFTELIRQTIVSLDTQVAVPDDLMEMKTMLATLGETWKQKWIDKGLAEGEAKGRSEGEAKARAEDLAHLMRKRFGRLDPTLLAQIHSADSATVKRWFDRAVDASDIPSVFQPPGE